MARVLLGVTGGIAAYKACELCRLLVRAGHEVTPVLTPDAERFVATHTFEALARREAPRDLYPHLVDADLLVIAPLSANTLAKLAHGLADNVLTQLGLAFRGPVLAAPAMNVRMWEHPATRRNLATAIADGELTVGPNEGDMACGEFGFGRMAEPPEILAAIDAKQADMGGGGKKPSAPAADAPAGPPRRVELAAWNPRKGAKAAKVTIVEFSDFQ